MQNLVCLLNSYTTYIHRFLFHLQETNTHLGVRVVRVYIQEYVSELTLA